MATKPMRTVIKSMIIRDLSDIQFKFIGLFEELGKVKRTLEQQHGDDLGLTALTNKLRVLVDVGDDKLPGSCVDAVVRSVMEAPSE